MEKNLRKVKFSINDLLEELRVKDIFDLGDVAFAVLETGGKLSVMKKAEKQTATLSDLKLPAAKQGLSANFILDGRMMKENMTELHRDEAWLREELMKNGLPPPEGILFAWYGPDGTLHVDRKHQDPRPFQAFQ